MGRRLPDYEIVSANEAERAIWRNVLIGCGSVAIVASLSALLSQDDKQGPDSPFPTVPSSVDISIEP